jgi:hypothetical protein
LARDLRAERHKTRATFTDFSSHVSQNPKGFAIDLLGFLASQSDYLSSVGSVSLSAANKERLLHVVMALEALYNVIKNNPGIGNLSILGVLCVLLSSHMNFVNHTVTNSSVQGPVQFIIS